MAREPRKPDEYVVHLFLEGSHIVDMRFNTLEEVKGWYNAKFKTKANEDEMMPLPMKGDNEILFVRPQRISAIHVEPVYVSSVNMF